MRIETGQHANAPTGTAATKRWSPTSVGGLVFVARSPTFLTMFLEI